MTASIPPRVLHSCCMQEAHASKKDFRGSAPCSRLIRKLEESGPWPSLWCYAVNQSDTNYVCHMTTRDCKWKTLRAAHPSALSNGAHRRRGMNEVSIDNLTHLFTISPLKKLITFMGYLLHVFSVVLDN